jgi:hypothetical protein
MICHDLDADIGDLARNALVGPEADRLLQHVATCDRCAARLERERALSEALGDLASSEPDARFEEMEACLLAAFSAVHPPVVAPAPARASFEAWRWLGVAAALVMAAALWAGWAWRNDRSQAPASTVASRLPTPVLPAAPAANEGMAEASRETSTPVSRPRRESLASARVAPPVAEMRFVPLPTAAGLPELESGTVVRVEFPMSDLPAYGIEIAPDAGARVVEADVLVGQDGQPRAIRFVNSESDSRRRQ